MLAVMNVVSIYDSFQILAFSLRPPTYALMNYDFMENEIENAVTEYSNTDSNQVRIIIHDCGVVQHPDTGQAKQYRKPIVALQLMIMDCMVRLVPGP